MHAPPEHTAHMVNSSLLYHGLSLVLAEKPVWLTMNPRDLRPILNPQPHLERFGLGGLAHAAAVSVHNCAPLVSDQFSPKLEELRAFVLGHEPSGVYLHYYLPFWYPVVAICREHNIPVGLHVPVFYHRGGSRRHEVPMHVEKDPLAIEAARGADFITVSQDADVAVVASRLRIPPSRVHVLPKGIPRDAWTDASRRFDRRFATRLEPGLREDQPLLTYIGRFEKIKNISWFLAECMPLLARWESRFQVLLSGWGSEMSRVRGLASGFPNVAIVEGVLSYSETLRLLGSCDGVIFPSGYDFAPRLPLEALSLQKPVVLGDFNFNHLYRPYAISVPRAGEDTAVLEYSNERVVYGRPDAGAMARAIAELIDSRRGALAGAEEGTSPFLDRLDGGSAPRVLLDAFESHS